MTSRLSEYFDREGNPSGCSLTTLDTIKGDIRCAHTRRIPQLIAISRIVYVGKLGNPIYEENIHLDTQEFSLRMRGEELHLDILKLAGIWPIAGKSSGGREFVLKCD